MMRYIYSFLFFLIMPLVMIRLLWRSIKAPDYRKRWKERLGFFKVPPKFKNAIWVHAVSVGEVLAGVPLIKSLQKKYPHYSVVVTTMTPTGSARVSQIFKDSVYHIYLPYDLPCIVKRFFNKVQPKIAVIMETEIWPNLLHECFQRKIPVLLGNARLSLKSMKYYQWIKTFIAPYLRKIDVIAPQSQQDAQHFLQLGADAKKIQCLGNMKFDIKPSDHIQNKVKVLKSILGEGRLIWIAGSTHDGEDEYILSAHEKIIKRFPQALLILVPRHPERFNKVAELCKKYQFKMARRSLNEYCDSEVSVYLGDTMGEMMVLYAASYIAFVGGSLVPTGGHNLLEPALFRLPVLSGPYTFNFTDITQLLLKKNGLIIVRNDQELANKIVTLLNDVKLRNTFGKQAYQVVLENQGALEKHLEVIEQLLKK